VNRRALVLGAAMVLLVSVVAVALRAFAEAAFLVYGERRLPWLLVANAGAFAIATLGYDVVTRYAPARVIDLALIVVLGIAAATAPALLHAGAPPIVLVLVLAAASQVTGLALWNRVAAAVAGRDARRALPRAGAAVTAGGAIAGLSAGALIPRVGLAAIPYGAAVVTIAALVLCVAQQRALDAGGAPGGAPGAVPEGPTRLPSVQRTLVAGLLAAAVLEAVVATVVDLQFLGTLKARYLGSDRAVALALFYGGTNAILFLLQVAAVPVLLVTRSLPFTAAIHPVALIATYAGFVAAPGFLGIAAARTTDQVLHLATSRTSQEVSLSALPPAPRARWKVLLRGVAWPAGAAATALVLLVTGPVHTLAHLATAAIAVAVAWAIAARITARRFQVALAAPLGIRHFVREDPRRIDLETLERWTRATADASATDAALARAALARARVDPSELAERLRHDDADVRIALFDQLARNPAPALRGELRAAVDIEDDDRALAAGIRALALLGDDRGITRGAAAPGLSRAVDDAVRSATRMLRGGTPDELAAELERLLLTDPAWAVAFARARRADVGGAPLDAALGRALAAAQERAAPAERARARGDGARGALLVLASIGSATHGAELHAALARGDGATSVLAQIDAPGARVLASQLGGMPALARAELCRAVAGVPEAAPVFEALVADVDPEVADAALRGALAVARSGGNISSGAIAAARSAALAALTAHLDARDAAATCTDVARGELDVATRRCVARLLWSAALEATSAGRDAAPLAASARHLVGGREPERKRALDVIQEHQAGSPELLAVLERWLGAPRTVAGDPAAIIEPFDAWLATVLRGELTALERALGELRRTPLAASVAGPSLAWLAEHAQRRHVTGTLFSDGEAGDTMFVVCRGTLIARRGATDRVIEPGNVVGELAVITHAPRAATVSADDADVLVIDRATFAAAAHRSPELVLGLSATLASWLAPERPDVL
jgi:hypothetical protein